VEYQLKFHPAAAKDLFKLAKNSKALGQIIIDNHLPKIVGDPLNAGRRKKGDLSHIFGYNFNYQRVSYRILYQVENDTVRIIALGVHDVAYKKAKKRREQ